MGVLQVINHGVGGGGGEGRGREGDSQIKRTGVVKV